MSELIVPNKPRKQFEIFHQAELFEKIEKLSLNTADPLRGAGDPFSDSLKADRNASYIIRKIDASALVPYPHLSHAGEYALLKRYKEFGDIDALDRLLLSSVKFVEWFAVRYLYRKNLYDAREMYIGELVNEGLMALLTSIRAYDLTRDPPPRLLGFAKWRIVDAINRQSDMDTIRFPDWVQDVSKIINTLVSNYVSKYGYFPKPNDREFTTTCFLAVRSKYEMAVGDEILKLPEDSWQKNKSKTRQNTADDDLKLFISRYLSGFYIFDRDIGDGLMSGEEWSVSSDNYGQSVEEEALKNVTLDLAKEYLSSNFKLLGISENDMKLYLAYLECDPLNDLEKLAQLFNLPKEDVVQKVYECRVKLSKRFSGDYEPLRVRKM